MGEETGERVIRAIKGKRTPLDIAIEGASQATGGIVPEAKTPLEQLKELQSVMGTVRNFLQDPLIGGAIRETAAKMMKDIQPQAQLANPAKEPNPVPITQSSKEAIVEGSIRPSSAAHAKLIVVFNEIPEAAIHKFLATFVGSEDIDVIRGKVKALVANFAS